MDLTSGENAVSWSLADFSEMQDQEILDWYKDYVDNLTERNKALENALAERKGRG